MSDGVSIVMVSVVDPTSLGCGDVGVCAVSTAETGGS